jgi:hypothetical protein
VDFINSREQMPVRSVAHIDALANQSEQLAVLSIQARGGSMEALQSVARRLSQNIRRSDYILLVEAICTVVLVGASFSEAEIVARRLNKLLISIEYDLQIVAGSAAQTLLDQLVLSSALRVGQDDVFPEVPVEVEDGDLLDTLPYLAFLSSYPSRRLLHLFPYELACHYRCVPVGAERGSLTIATQRRLSLDVLSHFGKVTQRGIFQVRCETGIINDILQYWQQLEPRLQSERC